MPIEPSTSKSKSRRRTIVRSPSVQGDDGEYQDEEDNEEEEEEEEDEDEAPPRKAAKKNPLSNKDPNAATKSKPTRQRPPGKKKTLEQGKDQRDREKAVGLGFNIDTQEGPTGMPYLNETNILSSLPGAFQDPAQDTPGTASAAKTPSRVPPPYSQPLSRAAAGQMLASQSTVELLNRISHQLEDLNVVLIDGFGSLLSHLGEPSYQPPKGRTATAFRGSPAFAKLTQTLVKTADLSERRPKPGPADRALPSALDPNIDPELQAGPSTSRGPHGSTAMSHPPVEGAEE